jgi:hypothetical protein
MIAERMLACGSRKIWKRTIMTLCPIALAVGCKKCPAFSVCPLKTSLGDYTPPAEKPKASSNSSSKSKKN